MWIKVLGSGSGGNGYVVGDDKEALLIECGVNAREMLKAIGFRTAMVAGCICSHGHGDHAEFIEAYAKYGVTIYMSGESGMGLPVTSIQRMQWTQIGNFTVIPFGVPHNGTECDGFLIVHQNLGKLLFITDAEMCPFDMSNVGINHVMVECNYSIDYLDVTDPNKEHILSGHMELQTCKRFVKSIAGDNLKSIGLIHLSNSNSYGYRFRKEIQEASGIKNVWIAEKGMEVDL